MNHVLVVDDEKSIRITLQAFLEEVGYSVSAAADADEAKALLETNRFGIVVTDIILPKINGVELLKYIKNISPGVEVIMMTGEPTVETATESLRMGAFDYLYKPITKDAVIKTVEKAFYVKQLNDEKKRLEKENLEYQTNLEHLVQEKTRALVESMELNNQIISNSKDAIVILDLEGQILFINPGGCDALGIDNPEEYIRTSWENFWEAGAISFLKAAIEKAASGQLGKFQGKVLPLKGPRQFWDATITPIFEENKKISRLLSIGRDLTETIQMENKIRAITQDWENIFQTVHHPMAVIDTSHNILHANEALIRQSGLSKNELNKKKCHNIFYPDELDSPPEVCSLEEGGRNGLLSPIVKEINCFKGTYLVACTPVPDEVGKIKNTILVATDISRLKEITTAHETLTSAMNLSLEGVAVIDADSVFQYVNSAFSSIFGMASKGLLLKNIFDSRVLDSANGLEENVSAVIETGRTWSGDVMIRTGNALQYYAARISPAKDELGRVKSYILIFNDKTELMQMEEQVRQTQKLESIGRLAGGVAHDFNNMLSPIIGFSEMAIESIPNDNPLVEDLVEILNAGKRAAALTRQLLAFSRKQILSMKTLDINEEIKDLHKMLGRLIGEDIQISLFLDQRPCYVNVDPTQFQQILMNLAVNARDAMPSGGALTIQTRQVSMNQQMQVTETGEEENRYIELMVKDSGTGMTPTVIESLFEPFFTTKDRDKGTGLGLSTVYGIVKQHNGHIQVKSEIGKGSVFRIYLEAQKEEPDDKKDDFIFPDLKGSATILVVEDDKGVLNVIKSSLRKAGFGILEAISPLEALGIVENHQGKIDLLLTDVILPVMNGKDLAEEIKKKIPDIKVLFMSGYAKDVIAGYGALSTGIHLINKPFSVSELRQKIQTVLKAEDK